MTTQVGRHVLHNSVRAPLRHHIASQRVHANCRPHSGDAALTRRSTFLAIVGLTAATPAFANTLSPDFVQETRTLAATINEYMTLDPFDKQRIQALTEIKAESKAWIAAHAKGGSAPGQAGKRMYVAVDAVLGHVNSNGAAPLPKQKVKFVAKTLEEVETLLSQGK